MFTYSFDPYTSVHVHFTLSHHINNHHISTTKWNITGNLIEREEFLESDIACTEGRTLILPVRLNQALLSLSFIIISIIITLIRHSGKQGCHHHLFKISIILIHT